MYFHQLNRAPITASYSFILWILLGKLQGLLLSSWDITHHRWYWISPLNIHFWPVFIEFQIITTLKLFESISSHPLAYWGKGVRGGDRRKLSRWTDLCMLLLPFIQRDFQSSVLGVPPRKEIGKRQDWTKWGWDCPVVSMAAWKDAVGLCPFPSSGWMVGPLHLWILAGCRLSREWTWPSEAGVHSLRFPEGAENWGSSSWSLNLYWGTIWASSNQQGDAAIPWKVRNCEALWSQLHSFPRWESWSGKTVLREAVRASEGPCLLTHLRLWGERRDPSHQRLGTLQHSA